MANLKQRLINNREVISFDNEQHCIRTKTDDIRTAEIWHDARGTFTGFKIWFNGEIIHSSKTFPSFEKRLNQLIEKWGLKEVNI